MVSHSDGDHVDGIAEALKDIDNISLMVDYGGMGGGNVQSPVNTPVNTAVSGGGMGGMSTPVQMPNAMMGGYPMGNGMMGGMPGGMMGGMMGGMFGGSFSSCDFTVVGYNSDSAMTAFVSGNASILEGGAVFDEGTSKLVCVIS